MRYPPQDNIYFMKHYFLVILYIFCKYNSFSLTSTPRVFPASGAIKAGIVSCPPTAIAETLTAGYNFHVAIFKITDYASVNMRWYKAKGR